MKNYKLTIIGAAVSVAIWLGVIISGVDLYEAFAMILQELERYELDELIIPLLVLSVFVFMDLKRRRKSEEIATAKIKIYKAMLSSTHHILNNFLNQMMLFKLTAEETKGFPRDVLALYDQIMKDALTQIEALGSIGEIDESSILESVAPKFVTSSSILNSVFKETDGTRH